MAQRMVRQPFAVTETFGAPTEIQTFIDEQRKTKNGRVEKLKPDQGVRGLRRPTQKKGVNNFLLFRRMAMMLFRNRPQSERSAIIRVMWEAERHKTSWALMARVWTFIRDQTEYNNIVAFLACAIDLIRTVPPDVWLATYKMVLVKDREGKVTLRQYGQPEPIRAPRDLSDFELLKGVVLRGLSVDDAEGLLRKMLQRSNHMMTVTTMDAEVITDVTDVTDDPDKADESFVNSVNQDPVMTFVELLGLPVTDNVFNFGVNVIDTNDVTNFNDTLVTTTGAHTHMRYQFDTSTVHLTRPEADSLDMNTQETNIAFDLGLPEQWQNHDGQISQGDYSASTGITPSAAPPFLMEEDFSSYLPAYDLQ